MIRVRFAPSPTGYLHIGSLRTYLYNWLFARKNKGKIILRIEDTDRKRYVKGATENLIKVLEKFGLNWDEGPIIKNGVIKQKGNYGPYIQSERIETYRTLAHKLVENGYAYYCFCSEERLKNLREEQIAKGLPPMYDRKCRNLSSEEIKEKIRKNIPYVIRLKVPDSFNGKPYVVFNDLIRGEIKFDLKTIDDQILLKSDNWPTYHLANVIDDHLMGVTHVIRGEEWLSSTPKHILLYHAFGWQIPKFAHLPLLLNPDRSKLSKRQGDIAVEDFLAQGYLPEAIINFIALLGWNPDTNQEIFSLKELIKGFSLEKVQKAGAILNRRKLDWINGVYIRKTNIKKLTELCLPFLFKSGLIQRKNKNKFIITETKEIISLRKIRDIVFLEQKRLKRLEEINELATIFFTNQIFYDTKLLKWKNTKLSEIRNNLISAKDILEKIPSKKFNINNLKAKLMELAEKTGTGELLWPLRVALTGKKASPPPFEIMEIIGKEKTLLRIKNAIEKLERYEEDK